MTDLFSADSERVGEVLDGRYRLEGSIGDGGMATVFRAYDGQLGRTVAVKLFRPGATEVGDERRRDSEKRLLAALSHPSLVTLFDAQLSDPARSYLVMEYVDGGTLTDRLTRGPVSAEDAASIVVDLGEALHVVHAAGIIHRDIKPSNILLRPPLTSDHTFRAVLADFGIAYLVDTARVTTPGMAVGTAAYISPEQVRGADPSPASDVYSLGLVLIEALTGGRAFPQQNSAEAIAARLTSPPVIPVSVGYAWRSLLARMTAIDPAGRPTAIEVARAGRELDAVDSVGPEQTQAAIEVTSATIDGPAVPLTAPTRLLPSPSPAPSPTSPDSPNPRTRAAAGVLPTGRSVPGRPARPALRRRISVAVVGVAAAVVLAIAAVVWIGSGAGADPAPDLPQVEDPLGTHLDDLLEQVTP